MAKEKILVAVDVGSYEVKVVVGISQSEDDLQIIGVGCSPSKSIKKGVVINIGDAVKSVTQALSDAEEMAGVHVERVYGCISGTHIQGMSNSWTVAVRGSEIDKRDVDSVLESCKAIKLDLGRDLIHSLPQEYIVDNIGGIKDPIGISGVRLEAKVYLITIGATNGSNVTKCMNKSGSQVKGLIVSPVASAVSVLGDDEKELGVLLLDIGAGITDMIVYKDGFVRHIDVLPMAGNDITSFLATNLKVPIAVAENIKKSYSLNTGSFSKKTIDINIGAGGAGRTEVSARIVSEMIEGKVKDIFNNVKTRIESRCDFPISSVVLCGGTANLRGIEQFAEEVFEAPTRVAKVRETSGLADLIKDPQYATVSGVLKAVNSGYSDLLNPTNQTSGALKIFKQIGNWFCENF
ncbi:MAG: cell division protein FtsA [Bdellovibrionota bacterium]